MLTAKQVHTTQTPFFCSNSVEELEMCKAEMFKNIIGLLCDLSFKARNNKLSLQTMLH